MQKRLIVVAVALASVAIPACAQRGGSHSAAPLRGGGLSSASVAAFHRGFAGPSRSNFIPQYSGGRQYSVRPAAPVSFNGRSDRGVGGADRNRDQRFRRPYSVYGLGLPYSVGFIGSDYFPYSSAFYDSSAAPQQQPADSYGPPPPEDYPAPVNQADAAPGPEYRPAYQRPQPETQLASEDALTLVFKDGRATEQIHNYLLTRKTLYVQDGRLREVPVEQLDLAAMAKVNGDAGVDFKLPIPVR